MLSVKHFQRRWYPRIIATLVGLIIIVYSIGNSAMSETDVAEEAPQVQAQQVAFDAVKEKLSKDYEYKTKVSKENDETWTFIVLPKARILGGGAQVTISKETLKVKKIMFLQ